MNLLNFMFRGGPVMWVILLCSLIAVYVIIERFLVLRQARLDAHQFTVKLKSMFKRTDTTELLAFCEENSAPILTMVRRGLLHLREGKAEVREILGDTARAEIYQLEKHLSLLATLAGAAPMIGFLGTVTGMMSLFHVVESKGGPVSTADIAGGIWEALLTTAFGLIVGVLALVFYNLFVARVKGFIRDLELVAGEFLDLYAADTNGTFAPMEEPPRVASRPVPDDDPFFRRK